MDGVMATHHERFTRLPCTLGDGQDGDFHGVCVLPRKSNLRNHVCHEDLVAELLFWMWGQ